MVEEFDAEDQGRFLKFVTSVSKPPLLGFDWPRAGLPLLWTATAANGIKITIVMHP